MEPSERVAACAQTILATIIVARIWCRTVAASPAFYAPFLEGYGKGDCRQQRDSRDMIVDAHDCVEDNGWRKYAAWQQASIGNEIFYSRAT